VAILKNGEVAYMMERHQIETRTAAQITQELTQAFDRVCETAAAAS
jgi:putative YphP/YqiW family bacilliredoxin